MSFTPYATAIAGSVLTAAFWNQQVRDNGNVLKTPMNDDGILIDDLWEATSLVAGELSLDLEAARHYTFTLDANVTTMTIDNVPATGQAAWFVLDVVADGSARTWAWLTGTVKWASGIPPVPTQTLDHWDSFLFRSYDGGATWEGSIIDQDYS